MSDRKPCVDCNRNIDATAKACPFCGWDQSQPARPKAVADPAPAPEAPARAPLSRDFSWLVQRRVLTAVGMAALLVIVFVIGALVHGREPETVKAPTSTINAPRAEVAPQAHSNIELVPTGTSGQSPQQPITSAPVASSDGSMADPYARDDATALPQSDYAQLAQRAQTKSPTTSPQFADPRSITGGVEGAQAPRPRRQVAVQSSVARTEPVAVYQPVPSMHVGSDATARLLLTVGADGRVKDIDIARALPGDTARLIGAVQEWRFRPATENGVPVASRFSVDITFHANE
jgi:TonB family protein